MRRKLSVLIGCFLLPEAALGRYMGIWYYRPPPTASPTSEPSAQPSLRPSSRPTSTPSISPTSYPSSQPSAQPIISPSFSPSYTAQPTTTLRVQSSNLATSNSGFFSSFGLWEILCASLLGVLCLVGIGMYARKQKKTPPPPEEGDDGWSLPSVPQVDVAEVLSNSTAWLSAIMPGGTAQGTPKAAPSRRRSFGRNRRGLDDSSSHSSCSYESSSSGSSLSDRGSFDESQSSVSMTSMYSR